MSSKQNCWEFVNCGREPAGSNADEMGVCPASTESSYDGLNEGINGGRICWAVSGTFCGGVVQGTHAQKRLSCLSCDFYKIVREQEGAVDFTLMKPGQKLSTSSL